MSEENTAFDTARVAREIGGDIANVSASTLKHRFVFVPKREWPHEVAGFFTEFYERVRKGLIFGKDCRGMLAKCRERRAGKRSGVEHNAWCEVLFGVGHSVG